VLTEPQVLDVLATVSDFNGFNVSCFGSTNGSIDQTISGGVKMSTATKAGAAL